MKFDDKTLLTDISFHFLSSKYSPSENIKISHEEFSWWSWNIGEKPARTENIIVIPLGDDNEDEYQNRILNQ